MESNREEQIRKNKKEFYIFIGMALFVAIFGIIGGLSIIITDPSFWVGHAVTYMCIGFLIYLLILIHDKPDFNPRTVKDFKIYNKSSSSIKKNTLNWFSENKFEVNQEKSNVFICTKIINQKVKYIFKIEIIEKKDFHNLYGEFYVFFDYNSKREFIPPTERSLSDSKIGLGLIYRRPAFFLMEDFIKNIQSN